MSQPAVLLKVMLLGESAVGKTSVFHRFVKNAYSETYKATIGADFYSKELTVDGADVVLQIWDTAGQERYKSLGVTFLRGSDVCILVYDICNLESFEALGSWVNRFLEGVGAPSNDPKASGLIFAVFGNKCDLEAKRQVSTEQGIAFCDNQGFLFFETSALSGHQVQEAFNFISRIAVERSNSLSKDRPYIHGGINLDDDDQVDYETSGSAGLCGC